MKHRVVWCRLRRISRLHGGVNTVIRKGDVVR